MAAEITENSGNIHVAYIRDPSESMYDIERSLVGWVGVHRNVRTVRASLILGEVGVGQEAAFSAHYRLDEDGKPQDMQVSGLKEASHFVVEALVGQDDTPTDVQTVYVPYSPEACSLYGENFASKKAYGSASMSPLYADGEINPPGSRFVFGNSQIIQAIKEGLSAVTPNSLLSETLYANLYYRLFYQHFPTDPILIDPSMAAETNRRMQAQGEASLGRQYLDKLLSKELARVS